MTRTRRTWTLLLTAAIALGCAIWFVVGQFTLADLARHEQALRGLIAAHPFRAWCVGWAVYFLAALVPGTRGKAIGFGWLFGFWPALLLVNFALTAAAQVAFATSRYLVRDAVHSRHTAVLMRINQLLQREGARYVLLLRVVPISFSLTNYLLGATELRATTYWWATQVGLLPGNIIFVFVGARLPSLAEVLKHGVWTLFTWDILAGLIVLSLFPPAAHELFRRWRPVMAHSPSVQ